MNYKYTSDDLISLGQKATYNINAEKFRFRNNTTKLNGGLLILKFFTTRNITLIDFNNLESISGDLGIINNSKFLDFKKLSIISGDLKLPANIEYVICDRNIEFRNLYIDGSLKPYTKREKER